MPTRAEATKAAAAKKGVGPKRAKKLAQRKATKTNREGPKVARIPRTKRDASLVASQELAANSPEAKARRAQAKTRRVRAKR